jgi:hypothetical protein
MRAWMKRQLLRRRPRSNCSERASQSTESHEAEGTEHGAFSIDTGGTALPWCWHALPWYWHWQLPWCYLIFNTRCAGRQAGRCEVRFLIAYIIYNRSKHRRPTHGADTQRCQVPPATTRAGFPRNQKQGCAQRLPPQLASRQSPATGN